jgi:hypothetical protein
MQTTAPLADRINSSKPWYKHRWPWLLMLGPALVIVAGSYTIWLAVSHRDAMVVDDYYTRGKAINQDLRRDRVATSQGLAFSARLDPASDTLYGTLQSFGKPLAGKIRIHLAHATQPEKDINLLVQADQQGQFSVALPMLERARWQVLIESEQRDWRLNGEWQWPVQKSVAIQADVPVAD